MSETSQGTGGRRAAVGGGQPPPDGTDPGEPAPRSEPEPGPSSFTPDPAQIAGTEAEDPGPAGGPTATVGEAAEEEGASGRGSVLPAVLAAVAVLIVAVVLVVLIVRTDDHSARANGPGAPAASPATSVPVVVNADQGSQTELIHGITLLKSQYDYLNTYGLVTLPWLAQRSPGVTWVPGATPIHQSDQVSLAITPESALVATRSKDGACWYVLDAEPGATAVATYKLPGPAMYFNMQSGVTCDGSNAPMNGWGQTFPQP